MMCIEECCPLLSKNMREFLVLPLFLSFDLLFLFSGNPLENSELLRGFLDDWSGWLNCAGFVMQVILCWSVAGRMIIREFVR